MDLLWFSLATLIAVIAAFYMYGLSRLKYIKDNWSKLRCDPLYMPLAGLVGVSVSGNFFRCAGKSFHDYAGFAMDPITAELGVVSESIGEIGGAMKDMRGLFSSVRGGFGMVFQMVFGKIQNLMSSMQYLMIRIRTMIGRLVGVFTSIVYAFYGGQQTGEAVMNGPIGKTISFLCFDPDTLIRVTPKISTPIKDLKLGDKLIDGSIINGLYILDGNNELVYKLDNARVTGSHKVWYEQKWIRVDEHPEAKLSLEQVPVLFCIDTTSHRVYTDKHIFMDFTEMYIPAVEKYIESIYNHTLLKENNDKYKNKLFLTGCLPGTLIPTEHGYEPIEMVSLGTKLENGDIVLGVTRHITDSRVISFINGVGVTEGTWIYTDNQLHIAKTIGLPHYLDPIIPRIICSLITTSGMYSVIDSNKERMYMLDKFGTTEPELFEMKDRIVCSTR